MNLCGRNLCFFVLCTNLCGRKLCFFYWKTIRRLAVLGSCFAGLNLFFLFKAWNSSSRSRGFTWCRGFTWLKLQLINNGSRGIEPGFSGLKFTALSARPNGPDESVWPKFVLFRIGEVICLALKTELRWASLGLFEPRWNSLGLSVPLWASRVYVAIAEVFEASLGLSGFL